MQKLAPSLSRGSKLLIICGPTATGKTKLGLEIARKFNGEIVSADSRQVYRGMDVGTGKDISGIFNFQSFDKLRTGFSIFNEFSNSNFQIGYYEIDGVRVWLLDIVEPDYQFNVADYKKCAEVVVGDIRKRGKLPIIVGGTGFYIKAVVDGIETMGIPPDWELREKLSHCSIDSLLRRLEEVDPQRRRGMNESDRQNPRRLIRAIEIARNSNFQFSKSKQIPIFNFQNPKQDTLFIGLTAPNRVLYQRIDQRAEERIRMGVEEEIRDLLKKGYNWTNSVLGTTIAYKEWQDYFAGKAKKEEVIQKWKFNEHSYSRRQMVWFKKDPMIKWFDITERGWEEGVEKLAKDWYSKVDAKKS